MKLTKYLPLLLLLVGCNKLPNTNSTGPSNDFIFKDSGIIQGTTGSDWDKIHDVSFTSNTQFEVMVNGVKLNKYEFSVDQKNDFVFGKQVTVWADGKISYYTPPQPVAPAGSSYTISWTN